MHTLPIPLVRYNSNLPKDYLFMTQQIRITNPELHLISSIVVETIATVYKEIITWKKLFGIFVIIVGIALAR